MCYCIFIWNQEVQNSKKGAEFYKRSGLEPIELNDDKYSMKNPLLFINGKPQEMISGLEFLERLQSSATTLKMKDRGCNNEKEDTNFKALHEAI